MADFDPIEYGAELFPVIIAGFNGNEESLMHIDATISEGHECNSEITNHPVEFGANVSDHAIVQPRVFSMQGFISAVDLRGNAGILDGAFYRGHTAWEELKKAWQEIRPLAIQTNLDNYTNLFITNLKTSQTWRNSLSLEFEATFQEVIIVSTTDTYVDQLSILDGPTAQQYASQIDRGVISTQTFEEA